MTDTFTDKTGSADATSAILIIPDIFDFSGQVLQVKRPQQVSPSKPAYECA